MTGFENLGLTKEIIHSLSSLGFKEVYEVQKKIIPLTVEGKNIVFTSNTGSGKTLAYSLGFLKKINKKLAVQMVILVPTRELCIQVGKQLTDICEILGFNVGTVYGGRDVHGDYRTLNKKNQIIVATPGRFIAHVNKKNIKIGDVKYLVFDESDQMFDEGFYDDCVYIIGRISNTAQIILSSATISRKVKQFMEEEIINYELLNIGTQIPENIIQEIHYCKIQEKNEFLLKYFSNNKNNKIMIFCNTKIKSDGITKFLNDNNFNAKVIHANLEQQERVTNLNQFKKGKTNILVATDIAARGLQIEQVDLIINYDIPTRAEFYIHRIGRSGRKGVGGHSLSLICPEDEERFNLLKEDYNIDAKTIN